PPAGRFSACWDWTAAWLHASAPARRLGCKPQRRDAWRADVGVCTPTYEGNKAASRKVLVAWCYSSPRTHAACCRLGVETGNGLHVHYETHDQCAGDHGR